MKYLLVLAVFSMLVASSPAEARRGSDDSTNSFSGNSEFRSEGLRIKIKKDGEIRLRVGDDSSTSTTSTIKLRIRDDRFRLKIGDDSSTSTSSINSNFLRIDDRSFITSGTASSSVNAEATAKARAELITAIMNAKLNLEAIIQSFIRLF